MTSSCHGSVSTPPPTAVPNPLLTPDTNYLSRDGSCADPSLTEGRANLAGVVAARDSAMSQAESPSRCRPPRKFEVAAAMATGQQVDRNDALTVTVPAGVANVRVLDLNLTRRSRMVSPDWHVSSSRVTCIRGHSHQFKVNSVLTASGEASHQIPRPAPLARNSGLKPAPNSF